MAFIVSAVPFVTGIDLKTSPFVAKDL